MRAEVFTNSGGVFEGVYEFPVLPAVGDRVDIEVDDVFDGSRAWTSWRVEGRSINGYRGELPGNPRVVLRLGRL